MEDHGTVYATRFKRVREAIEAMKEIWTKEAAEYHGEFVNFDPMIARPKPVQKPHPPIHVGGAFPYGARRAIRYGDGWIRTARGDVADISLTERRTSRDLPHSYGEYPLNTASLLLPACRFRLHREGLARGYLQQGDCPSGAEPVAKIVEALPGDVLDVQPGRVSVDGQVFADSAVAARDSTGRPLPHVPWGRLQVAPGEVGRSASITCGAGTRATSDRFRFQKFERRSSRFSLGESWRQTDIATSRYSESITSPTWRIGSNSRP